MGGRNRRHTGEDNVVRLRRALAAVFHDPAIEEVPAGRVTIKVVSPATRYA